MGAARRLDLDRRLEAYFATLRSSSLKDVLKRSAGNWQVYAAVTSSAMAMVTSASASIIGNGSRAITSDSIASARTTNHHLADKNLAFMNALGLIAEPNLRQPFLVAVGREKHASQPGPGAGHFPRRRCSSGRHRKYHSTWRMGIDLREQPG